MYVLKDEQLEAVVIIKEIDTLKVIRTANEINLKQRIKRLKLLVGIMLIFCILAQLILFKWIEFSPKAIMLSGIYILCASLILLVIRYQEGKRV